jgi:hypothetical protein
MRRGGDARAGIGDGKAVFDTGGAARRRADGPAWTGAILGAATGPALHQIVLLVTSDGADDQTLTLSGGTWMRHQATPCGYDGSIWTHPGGFIWPHLQDRVTPRSGPT